MVRSGVHSETRLNQRPAARRRISDTDCFALPYITHAPVIVVEKQNKYCERTHAMSTHTQIYYTDGWNKNTPSCAKSCAKGCCRWRRRRNRGICCVGLSKACTNKNPIQRKIAPGWFIANAPAKWDAVNFYCRPLWAARTRSQMYTHIMESSRLSARSVPQ